MFPTGKLGNTVILFVRMWVEIDRDYEIKRIGKGHPLREDVSWNDMLGLKTMSEMRHPLREDVSWNDLEQMLKDNVYVILFVRMWVEIHISQLCSNTSFVILFVRMWVEMFAQLLKHMLYPRHPLREDVSWNCFNKSNITNHTSSSSSWGCELKYFFNINIIVLLCHPLREDVSWNTSITGPWTTSKCHPLREDVSWNTLFRNLCLDMMVILFVRMWVEMYFILDIVLRFRSSSSWGCELKL